MTRHLVILIVLAVGVRIAVIGGSLMWARQDASHYAALHDGAEYQAIACGLFSPAALRDLQRETQRLSPGYPAAIRIASALLPASIAALAISVLAAAAAVLLFYLLTRDVWLAAYFAVFTPSWLLFSSVAMSEGLFLALALTGFYLWRKNRPLAAALTLGILTLVRPAGVFVFAAIWLAQMSGPNRSAKRLAGMAAIYALAPLIWLAASALIWQTPFRQLDAYWQKDFAPPFLAIVRELFSFEGERPKQVLTAFTILTNAAAIILLLRQYRDNKTAGRAREETLAWLLWIGWIALFILTLPSSWAYRCLDRFFVACLPAMMIGLAPFFPRRWWAVAAMAAVGVAICLYWNHNMFRVIAVY
ncbi:MAG: hypothetical protein NTX50_21840 [Candidatus Sumerlaeota bacterium]|nr:hypothetical protein [Candidatus Sumerlaeota bacterium]